jgi:hypothetical protein
MNNDPINKDNIIKISLVEGKPLRNSSKKKKNIRKDR